MNKTQIEWVKNPDGTQGYTWNPITGCLNHINGMCKGGGFPCYAYKLAHGRLKNMYLNNGFGLPKDKGILGGSYPTRDPFYPRFWPERLADIPKDWKTLAGWQEVKSRGIFVCDMSELFGDWIPQIWQEIIFEEIRKADQHRFYLLTKQPQNLIKFSPFPDNCWVGVTACNTVAYSIAVKYLQVVSAKVKYISIEPMLSRIITNHWELDRRGINWLIIGAQTKPYKPPKIEWIKEIVEAADKAGVPVFLKDNLSKVVYETRPNQYIWAFNHQDKLRQDMPK